MPTTNSYGYWSPPLYRNGFRQESRGKLYRWEDGIISPANDCRWSNNAFRTSNNARLTQYRCSTLFFNGLVQFVTVPGNASQFDIATEDPHQWLPLTFHHDSGLSRVSEAGPEVYLEGNGLDWINNLGLATYTHLYRHTVPHGELSGNLAIIVGLIAFSCVATEFENVLLSDQAWRGCRWAPHGRRDGRESLTYTCCYRTNNPSGDDHRGVVVNIYYDPRNSQGSTRDLLYALEWRGPALLY